MKLYIAGKVTGDSNYQTKFAKAEMRLADAGYETVNPVRLVPENTSWNIAMKMCIKALLDCDGVALLPDWDKSRGATDECFIALELDIPHQPIEQWLLEVPND